MATDLSFGKFGSVPAFYREVYNIVCPNAEDHVDHDMFVNLLVKSSLPKHTLTQIWDAVDNKQGYLNRTGIYTVLALAALAQQGKSVNVKLLESYSDQDLPKPCLGDLTELKAMSMRVRRDRMPNVLGYKFDELCDFDQVKVELVPEKKGLILKHVEYEVTSRRYKSTVLRRYNDFVAFQEIMLIRFPYRMIPRLPPKKMMGADRKFIEMRRRALKRFLNLTVRHPILTNDDIVKYFLTFNGSDMQYKIKEQFRGVPDEFMTHEFALKAKEFVPMDTQLQFGSSRDHARLLLESVCKLRDIAERVVFRATSYASDMLQLGKELGSLSADSTTVSAWGCGNSTTWFQLKTGFKHLSVEYTALADKASTEASRQEQSVVEELNMYLDVLLSYRDLCERHEKGVLTDHQRALQKMAQYKKRHMSATVHGPSEATTVEQLEQRILRQENEILNKEKRNYFSLHCVQMETQLIHANMESLHVALHNMSMEEGTAHSELATVWQHIQPIIRTILDSDVHNGITSKTQKMSPLGSPRSDRSGGLVNES